MKGKSPWGAAILNFLIPGLGYLYVGRKRMFLSVGLLVSSIIVIASPTYWTSEGTGLLLFGGLVAAIAFAADAYKDAEETQVNSAE